jgi:hypothetical protein
MFSSNTNPVLLNIWAACRFTKHLPPQREFRIGANLAKMETIFCIVCRGTAVAPSSAMLHKRWLAGFLLFLSVTLLQAPLEADSSAEALCEKLHSESLKKAKQALVEGKKDEALRFLQEAAAISKRCASLPESDRHRGLEENILASAPSANQVSARVFL